MLYYCAILYCSLFYVKQPELFIRVMSTNPSYLRSTVNSEVVQYRDWGIPFGSRFRALKLWFYLRLDGPDAIRARLRCDLDNAHWFASQVETAVHWQVLMPVTLQTICIRHQPLGLGGTPWPGSMQLTSREIHSYHLRSLKVDGWYVCQSLWNLPSESTFKNFGHSFKNRLRPVLAQTKSPKMSSKEH
jgi:glutamate/tyrosine decarboxylase-like PLP-dependent enzyme